MGRRALGALRPTRRGLAKGAVLAGLAGFLIGGLAQVGIETGIDSFLPGSDPSLRQYERVASSFGGAPIVVLLQSSQPRELLGDGQLPRVLTLEGRLSRADGVAAVYGPATTLNQIAGQAQRLGLELAGRRAGLRAAAAAEARQSGASSEQVREASRQAVAGFDQRYEQFVRRFSRIGLPTLSNPRFVRSILYNASGQPRPRWEYLVPNERSLAILVRPTANLSQGETERLVGTVRNVVDQSELATSQTTVSGVPTIVAALGDQVGQEIPLIGGIAVLAIAACLLFVPWTKRRRRLLPLAVTVLATGLTVASLGWLNQPVSLGVVAFLPVLVGLGTYYPIYFARGARPRVVLIVAAGTTAGFVTLALSPLPFVQDLGLTLALGVGFAFALGWLTVRRTGAFAQQPTGGEQAGNATRGHRGPETAAVSRVTAGVAVVAVAAAGWALLPRLALETNIEDLTGGLPVTEQAERAEQVLGAGGEIDVVLRGPDVLTPRAWQWMRAARQTVIADYGDRMDPVLSPPGLLGFLGPSPTQAQIEDGVRLLPPYLTNAVLRSDYRSALLSYGVELDDLEQLRALTTAVNADLPPAPPGYEAALTGLPTVAVRGYELVSNDRYLANLAGVVAAGTVLLLGLRRRADAARAVLAAGTATGVALFLLWVTGTALNPLTVALGSLTAAVGCEFTVMFAESARTGDRTLRRAVLLAMLTSGAGYLVLVASQLAVMQQFGLLLAVSVVLSYLAARLTVWVWPPAPSGTPHSGWAPHQPQAAHQDAPLGVT